MRALLYREKFLQPEAICAAGPVRAGVRLRSFYTGALLAVMLVGLPGCQAQVRAGDRLAADPHWQYADASLAEQDPEDALAAGEAASWQTANDQGILAARARRLLEAEASLHRAAEIPHPQAWISSLNLARLYVLLGEDDQALAAIRAALDRRSISPDDLRVRALLFESQNRRTEARLAMRAIAGPVLDYRRSDAGAGDPALASAREPDAIAAALWIAGDELRALRYGPARDLYDRVLSIAPENAAALFGRGYISYLAEDWGGASSLLSAAQRAGSTEPELPYYLVHSLYKQDEFGEALKIAGEFQTNEMRLLDLHGRLRLLTDYRADLTDLIQRARPQDRDTLRARWYGAEDLRKLPELDSEFRLLY